LGEARVRNYTGALAAFAVALVVAWSYRYGLKVEPQLVVGTAVFACFIFLGDLFSIRVSERTSIGVWNIPVVAAVVMLGPTWAALATIPSALYVGRRNPLRTVYELSHGIVIVYLAGIVYFFASQPLLLDDSGPLATILYGTLVAGIVEVVASEVISGILLKVKYGQSVNEIWRETVQPYLVSEAVNVLTAGLAVLTLVVYGPPAAIVVVAGSIGSLALMYRSREQVKENEKLRARVGSLEEALATSNTSFGTMIIRDLGQRDGYTHRHAAATATYAADLAREMRLDDTHAERLRMAGLLHNIGLLGLPDDILLAGGRPNSIARSRLDEHPARGEEALAAISEFGEMASWVRWHHERPDGRGYPDKLRGPWIPLEARILAVAQAYAAMVLDQPRRPAMVPAKAREQLSAGIDTEFDGVVVRALLRLLDTESEGYRMADDHRFVFPSLQSIGGARPGASDPRVDENLGQALPR
jgi:HD-GYP domain-containing protein (c-di-GMP phosphodiesterase class II)